MSDNKKPLQFPVGDKQAGDMQRRLHAALDGVDGLEGYAIGYIDERGYFAYGLMYDKDDRGQLTQLAQMARRMEHRLQRLLDDSEPSTIDESG